MSVSNTDYWLRCRLHGLACSSFPELLLVSGRRATLRRVHLLRKKLRVMQVPAHRVPRTGWAPTYVPPAARCVALCIVFLTRSTAGFIASFNPRNPL